MFRTAASPACQYQIGRCSGPCVGLVEAGDYAESVRRAAVPGRAQPGARRRAGRRDAARQRRAGVRGGRAPARPDRHHSQSCRRGNRPWTAATPTSTMLAVAMQGRQCLRPAAGLPRRPQPRHPRLLPRTNGEDSAEEVLAAFVSRSTTRSSRRRPRSCWTARSRSAADRGRPCPGHAGRKVELRSNVRRERAAHLDLVRRNAELALATELTSSSAQQARVEALRDLLGLADRRSGSNASTSAHAGRGDRGLVRGVRREWPGAQPVPPLQHRHRRSDGSRRATTTPPCTRPCAERFRPVAEGEAGPCCDVLLIDGGAGRWRRRARCCRRQRRRGGPGRRGQGRTQAGAEALLLPDGHEVRRAQPRRRCNWSSRCATRPIASPSLAIAASARRARTTSHLEDIAGIGPRRRRRCCAISAAWVD